MREQPLEERAVLPGIDDVDATSHDGQRAAFEGPDMGPRVDAERHAGHHRHAGGAEFGREPLGQMAPVRRGVTRPHDGDRFAGQQAGVAAQREQRGRIGDGGERGRIGRLAQRDQVPAEAGQRRQFALGGGLRTDADGLPPPAPARQPGQRVERRRRPAEAAQQGEEGDRADVLAAGEP